MLYAMCCFHKACGSEVLFCNILCWMKEIIDTLDAASERALHH